MVADTVLSVINGFDATGTEPVLKKAYGEYRGTKHSTPSDAVLKRYMARGVCSTDGIPAEEKDLGTSCRQIPTQGNTFFLHADGSAMRMTTNCDD